MPIILIKISCVSTRLLLLILSKSSFEMRFAELLSTPNGKRCFDVISGNPLFCAFGEV